MGLHIVKGGSKTLGEEADTVKPAQGVRTVKHWGPISPAYSSPGIVLL